MKFSISSLFYDIKGYDILAALDEEGAATYLRMRKECEDKARKYLEENPKPDYFVLYAETETCVPRYFFVSYSDDEIRRIKEYLVEDWNEECEYDSSKQKAKSFEEIKYEDIDFSLLLEDKDFESLLWGDVRDYLEEQCDLKYVDIRKPIHCYRMRTWEYDKSKDEMIPCPRPHLVELTDEEYLYLLTEQLFDDDFSFNRLLLYKPELAREICNATDGTATMYALNPYLIIMDEVVEDAKKIKEMEK